MNEEQEEGNVTYSSLNEFKKTNNISSTKTLGREPTQEMAKAFYAVEKLGTSDKLYVVQTYKNEHTDKNDEVYTLSFKENENGWETDCGHFGYGLCYADAEKIASAFNGHNDLCLKLNAA